MTRWPVAASLLVGLLVLPSGTAQADLGRQGDEDITDIPIVQRFVTIAADYWHVSPAQVAASNGCGEYTVEVGPTVDATTEGEALEPGCWQRWAPATWNQLVEERANTEDLRVDCLLAVHEYGHSTGHAHVADPANVMYPGKTSLTAVPGCTSAFPLWFELARHRAPHASRRLRRPRSQPSRPVSLVLTSDH
jgi:hypothetical protein